MQSRNSFRYFRTDNEIDLYINNNSKFKTNLVQLVILNQLEKKTVSKNALIPFILYRGSERYPNSRDFKIILDELYGAELNVSVWKRGEVQIINFSLEIVNEKFLPTDEPLLKKGIALLKELVLNPYFTDEFFQQERDFIIDEIKSIINDKYSYSLLRSYQEMCHNEPYSLHKLGVIEEHKRLTREKVYEQYEKMIRYSKILLFVIGDVDEEKVYEDFNENFIFKHKQDEEYNKTIVRDSVDEVKEIEERLNVQQGKLVLGFRTGISKSDKLYYPLLMFNGILGAFPHSKLFQNVREKESLAYYASSNIESTKGLLVINSGIEFTNYSKTKDIIIEQIEEIRNGNISDEEFNWTQNSLISSFESMGDNIKGLFSHYLLGLINQQQESIGDSINRLSMVNKEDIINVGKKIKLDTVYFLNKKVVN